MKKIFSLLLTLIFIAAALPACAKPAGTSAPASSPSPTATPTVVTPTPVTPTPEEPKFPVYTDLDGTAATEEDLGVLPVGRYTVRLKSTGEALGYAGRQPKGEIDTAATVGGDSIELMIVFQTWKKDPYYLVFAGEDSMHVLASTEQYAISDGEEMVFRGKQYTSGSTTYYEDMFETMQWMFIKDDDGSYKIKNNTEGADLYLNIKNGKVVVEKKLNPAAAASFEVELVERGGGNAFEQYISDAGDVVVRLPSNIRSRTRLKPEELQLWANNLELAYRAYIELTSFVAHDNVVVKCYEPSPHIGYVRPTYSHDNVITMSNSFMYTDLSKMRDRAKKDGVVDWNFGVLHEMGHLFDGGRQWNCESEMMTDAKIPYVLQRFGGCAAPSEHPATEFYYADGIEGHPQIEECYTIRAGGEIAKTLTYGAYGAALKFTQIQRAVDDEYWTAFRAMFKSFMEQEDQDYHPNYEKFTNMINRITETSGKDARALFTVLEWNVYQTQFGNPDAIRFLVEQDGSWKYLPTGTLSLRAGAVSGAGVVSTSTLTYRSENPEIATVDETGLITGVSRGSVRIIVSAEGFESYVQVTVA